jgi:hypothetical protein
LTAVLHTPSARRTRMIAVPLTVLILAVILMSAAPPPSSAAGRQVSHTAAYAKAVKQWQARVKADLADANQQAGMVQGMIGQLSSALASGDEFTIMAIQMSAMGFSAGYGSDVQDNAKLRMKQIGAFSKRFKPWFAPAGRAAFQRATGGLKSGYATLYGGAWKAMLDAAQALGQSATATAQSRMADCAGSLTSAQGKLGSALSALAKLRPR